MANWCYNYVTCAGSAEDIARLKQALLDGREHARVHNEATDLGVIIEEGCFFDIEIGDEQSGKLQFSYESKWSPNLLDLAQVCRMHNLSAVSEYNECGMRIYGKATIDAEGNIDDDEVTADFLDLLEYNEETGCYECDGIEYETEGDFIEEKYAEWKESQLKTNI